MHFRRVGCVFGILVNGTCTDADSATTTTLEKACTTPCSGDGSGGSANDDGVDCNLNADTNTWRIQRSINCETLRLDPCGGRVHVGGSALRAQRPERCGSHQSTFSVQAERPRELRRRRGLCVVLEPEPRGAWGTALARTVLD